MQIDLFYTIIIIYNKRCVDSTTCRSLKTVKDPAIKVIIFDNSTKDLDNAKYSSDNGWDYLSEGSNIGISRAYNKCIQEIRRNTNKGFICLFDDDSIVDSEYFVTLSKMVNEFDYKIHVPIIYSKQKLLSPCIISDNYHTRRIRDEKELSIFPVNRLSAINSGMAIDISLFEDYRYDENIFLDGVDHKFLKDMNLRGHYLHIMPYRCKHEFSGDTIQSAEGAKHRFRIYVKDYHYLLRGSPITFLYLVGKRALHLALKYKSFEFIRIFANFY